MSETLDLRGTRYMESRAAEAIWVLFATIILLLAWILPAFSLPEIPASLRPLPPGHLSGGTPDCLSPISGPPSSSPGKFCGGPPPIQVGRHLDLNRECKELFGTGSVAVEKRQDAYGWVCREPGQEDKVIDIQRACRRAYGNNAISALVGLGSYDWRCLTPSDVSGRVVPVLLYPGDHLSLAEAPFAADSLKKINTLMSGVRSFYEGKTSTLLRTTNAFIFVTTSTSASEWQKLALCTDASACAAIGNPIPVNRYVYANRIKTELNNGRWNTLLNKSSMRLAAFVSLGASPAQTPTWCGAAELPGDILVSAPSNSYAACTPTTNNPPDYENAFYGTAHELGHAMGLPHSDFPGDPANPNDGCMNDPPVYVFNDTNPNSNLIRPANLADSVMCLGKGTSSELFPFEVHKLLPFLLEWH